MGDDFLQMGEGSHANSPQRFHESIQADIRAQQPQGSFVSKNILNCMRSVIPRIDDFSSIIYINGPEVVPVQTESSYLGIQV